MSAKTSNTKPLQHVNFNTEDGEINDRKKRYLTAKYGQHQMNLIKKRLKVEMWMYEQLQALFQVVSVPVCGHFKGPMIAVIVRHA